MAQPPRLPPSPARGFPPVRLTGLAGRLMSLALLGNAGLGELADRIKTAVDTNDGHALDEVLESVGSAYVLMASLNDDLKKLDTTLTSQLTQLNANLNQINGKLNSLDARVTALERRP